MLPAPARLRSSTEFAYAFRGRRVQRGHLVVHLNNANDSVCRVGLSVSKIVGNSVTRHSVARRLRHVLSSRLDRLPEGSRLVVRALPSSALATSADLAANIDAALEELVRA
jgi:ribonuclease P protein component